MNCAAATELMLEADLPDLQGDGDRELAAHLAECERCRTIGAQFLSAQVDLAREIDGRAPGRSVEEALIVAKRESARQRRRNAILQIGAPIAAAAGLAGVMMFGDGNNGTETLFQVSAPEPLPGLEVTAPPGKDVAVFNVADRPDVVVVWFFDAGDE